MGDARAQQYRKRRPRHGGGIRRVLHPWRGQKTIWSLAKATAISLYIALVTTWAVVRRISMLVSALHFVSPITRARLLNSRFAAFGSGTGAPTKARIIINPASGGVRGENDLKNLWQTAAWMSSQGVSTEVYMTAGQGAAHQLAAEAVKTRMQLVVVAGGDGTINEVIQALAGQSTTALGVLPCGTINIWAREVGIPLNIFDARRVLLSGVHRQIDLGLAGNRYFLLMAGIGLDAEVARRVEHHKLKELGLKVLGYFSAAMALGITQPSARIWTRRRGQRRGIQAVQILILNTRLYAGALSFAPRAKVDDGWLDVVVIGQRLRDRVHVFIDALLHRPSRRPFAYHNHVRRIRVMSDIRLPVQVDGEIHGCLPMTFSVCPHALTVIVPHTQSSDLFVDQPTEMNA